VLAAALGAAGCGTGAPTGRGISPAARAALVAAAADPVPNLDPALAVTLAWLDTPAAAEVLPADDRARARVTLERLVRLRTSRMRAGEQADAIAAAFDLRPPAGGDGTVLFTGYFAPEFPARRTRSDRFRHPLHAAPAGPPADPARPGPTRRRITVEDLHAGHELAWLADPLDAYLVHVNGSARLRFTDATTMVVGHVATNERPYTSLGRLLIEDRLVPPEQMSMQAIRAAHRADPARVEALMLRNERYVYFRAFAPDEPWPRSGFDIPLVAAVSAAVDPAVVPPGTLLLLEADLPRPDGTLRRVRRFAIAHDRGAAIRGPARVDLFTGIGPEAGAVAGRMRHRGRLWVLVPRSPEPASALALGNRPH
jgi:membrane-bound lytic murein transglycosylase A